MYFLFDAFFRSSCAVCVHGLPLAHPANCTLLPSTYTWCMPVYNITQLAVRRLTFRTRHLLSTLFKRKPTQFIPNYCTAGYREWPTKWQLFEATTYLHIGGQQSVALARLPHTLHTASCTHYNCELVLLFSNILMRESSRLYASQVYSFCR